jgi:hypothetical protein
VPARFLTPSANQTGNAPIQPSPSYPAINDIKDQQHSDDDPPRLAGRNGILFRDVTSVVPISLLEVVLTSLPCPLPEEIAADWEKNYAENEIQRQLVPTLSEGHQ